MRNISTIISILVAIALKSGLILFTSLNILQKVVVVSSEEVAEVDRGNGDDDASMYVPEQTEVSSTSDDEAGSRNSMPEEVENNLWGHDKEMEDMKHFGTAAAAEEEEIIDDSALHDNVLIESEGEEEEALHDNVIIESEPEEELAEFNIPSYEYEDPDEQMDYNEEIIDEMSRAEEEEEEVPDYYDPNNDNEAEEEEYPTSNVEIDSDGSIQQAAEEEDKLARRGVTAASAEDYERYKTETISMTERYKSKQIELQKIVDKYNELTKRQEALHDKIVTHNANQLKLFPFPILEKPQPQSNSNNMEAQDYYVTKEEVEAIYTDNNNNNGSSWENELVDTLHDVISTNFNKGQCDQQQPKDDDLIHALNTQLQGSINQRTAPPQNKHIRLLYLNALTSNTYTPPPPSSSTASTMPSYIYHSLGLKGPVPSPNIIFSSDPILPFSCWPIQGTNGAISFKLPKPLKSFHGIQILHSPQDISSAPNHIRLLLDDDIENKVLIDSHFNPINDYHHFFNVSSLSTMDELSLLDHDFHEGDEYYTDSLYSQQDAALASLEQEFTSTSITSNTLEQELSAGSCSEVEQSCSMPPQTLSDDLQLPKPQQTHKVQEEKQQIKDEKPIQKMTLYFDNNWGNPQYTCFYRLIIHGEYM